MKDVQGRRVARPRLDELRSLPLQPVPATWGPSAPQMPAIRLAQQNPLNVLRGATVLVTGCNSGLGNAIAKRVLRTGARLLFTCRTDTKVTETAEEFQRAFPGGWIRGRTLDLSELAGVDRFCKGLQSDGICADYLILNAGVHVPFSKRLTDDGFELHHQVNFLSAARLFLRLSEEGRQPLRQVVYVSSDAHKMGHLPPIFPLSFWARYAKSKLRATTFFQAARPLFPETVISVLSPGNVDTAVHRHKHWLVKRLRDVCSGAQPAEDAAEDLLQAAFASGKPELYWNRGKTTTSSPRCSADDLRLAVWREGTGGLLMEWALTQVLENHARTMSQLAPAVRSPSSDREVAGLVREAMRRRKTVRVVGSRHSYNDCFYSSSVLISLEKLTGIGSIGADSEFGGPTITVGAGVTVQELCDHLDSHGYALPYAGNSGAQTVVGAAITGTHGYCREGGVMAELIVGLSVVTGTGEVVSITDEAELRGFRVSLGSLGIVTSVTLAVQPKGHLVRYSAETLGKKEFIEGLLRATRENEYFRFLRSRFHPEQYSVVTINRTTETSSPENLERVRYLDQTSPPRLLVAVLRFFLGSTFVHVLFRRLPAPRLTLSFVAEFSTLLFVNAGIVNEWHWLARLLYQVWNNDRTRNMEIAIRPRDFERFLHVFEPLSEAYRTHKGRFETYFTGRYVGGSRKALLAPNYGRDTLFIDVHVGKSPTATSFLQELEEKLKQAMPVRPHWGKEFWMTHDDLREAYPSESWDVLRTLKRKYDPQNLFSNAFTRRVLGW